MTAINIINSCQRPTAVILASLKDFLHLSYSWVAHLCMWLQKGWLGLPAQRQEHYGNRAAARQGELDRTCMYACTSQGLTIPFWAMPLHTWSGKLLISIWNASVKHGFSLRLIWQQLFSGEHFDASELPLNISTFEPMLFALRFKSSPVQ